MIRFDQPTIFKDKIVAAVSSVEDGNMRFTESDGGEVRANRRAFLNSLHIDTTQATLLRMTYDTTDFARIIVLDDDHQGLGILSPEADFEADSAVVTRPGHAVFLLIADCAGAVIYDPDNEILMVSHLGRHNVEQLGAKKDIEFLMREFDTNPANLLIWLSPMVGKETYPLHAFSGRGLQDVIVGQFTEIGVAPANIELSPSNTADSNEYFSHSEFLAGNRDLDGRFAIVAMMRE